jgi:iron complex outermembrane receptor protein
MPIDLARERTQLAGGAGAWQHDLERGEYAMNELVVSPRLSWKGQSGQFGLWPSLYLNDGERRQTLTRQQQTLPGGASVAAGGRRDDEDSAIRILRLRGEGETRLGENKLAARAAWMHGERTAQRRRATFAASGVTSGQWREDERREDDEFSVGLRLDRPLGTQHFFSMGAEFSDHRRQDRLQAVGTVGFGDDFSGRARQVGLWLQDEWRPEEALALTLGLRGEAVRLAAAGDARRHGHLSPSLALRWEPAAGWIARASAGGAMRFPKLEELTSKRDRSLAANTPLEPDLSGNPGLMPERIVNFEIGLDRQLAGNAGQLGANLYARRTRDFIEREVAFDGARWLARPENVGEARHWGLELSAKLNRAAFLPHGDGLRAQLTLPRGAVEDARRGVSRRPRELPRYVLTFAYEGSLPAWQSSWSLQWQRLGESRTDIPGFENQRLKRRDLVDLSVTRRLDAQLSLRLQLQNLFAAARENDGAAVWGADTWRLAAREPGKTSWLLSLEGKW